MSEIHHFTFASYDIFARNVYFARVFLNRRSAVEAAYPPKYRIGLSIPRLRTKYRACVCTRTNTILRKRLWWTWKPVSCLQRTKYFLDLLLRPRQQASGRKVQLSQVHNDCRSKRQNFRSVRFARIEQLSTVPRHLWPPIGWQFEYFSRLRI